MTKPKAFISSALAGLAAAREVGRQLQAVAEAMIWSEGAFRPGKTVTESLLDFAVFVLTADVHVGRRRSRRSPRPNLI